MLVNHRVFFCGVVLSLSSHLTASGLARVEGQPTPSPKLHPTLLQRLAKEDPFPVKTWVFFTDKGLHSARECAAAIEQVQAEYNPRAVQRRALRGLSARRGGPLFSVRDLSVAQQYVEAVTTTGAKAHVTSRWLNAVSVYATRAQVEAIARLPFVKKLQPVARAAKIVPPVPAKPSDEAPSGRGAGSLRALDYGRSQAQLEQINLVALHEEGYTGQGVVVGILDTGFRRSHEAFNQPGHVVTVVAEYDFVDDDGNTGVEAGDPSGQHDHGTMILGCIGSYKTGDLVGGAYDATFILCKTEDTTDEYEAEEDNYVAGLEFIESNGGDMATSSLGYIDWYTQNDLDGLTAVTTIAVNSATSNGIHCCTAAGNEYHDSDPNTSSLIAPADAFQVITCGAVDIGGAIASFSSDGPTADGRVKPELLARGVSTDTVSPSSDTGYTTANGTSLSTPLVATAVACLIQAHPEWTVDEMRQGLFQTADYYTANGTYDPLYVRGYGVVNALAPMRDCNSNSIPDVLDIGAGTSQDCQHNDIPDECDIFAGTCEDCNNNAVPDVCDVTPADPQMVDDVSAVLGWAEISGTGTALGLSDDGEAEVTMPFTNAVFPNDSVQVGNNGGIGFGGTADLPYSNGTIPNSGTFGGAQALFPFWDDIDSDTGNVYYETVGTSPDRTFIVEWHDRPHYSGDSTLDGDEATFQVQVFETPVNAVWAQFLYLDTDFQDSSYDDGASATIGYQASGNDGSQWSNNQPGAVNPTVVLSLESLGSSSSPDCNANGVPDECDPSGDFDADGFIDLSDYALFSDCLTGPCLDPPCGTPLYADPCCTVADFDQDNDVDLLDFAAFAEDFTG